MDASLLQAALEGLEQQKAELDKKIATVRALLGARKPAAAPAPAPAPARKKRKLSRAARKRISDAQKRRWALAKAAKKPSKGA